MNEILACLYFAFYDAREPKEMSEFFESDLFFCFNIFLSELKDSFIRTMDNEPSGINGKVAEFSYLLEAVDPELA